MNKILIILFVSFALLVSGCVQNGYEKPQKTEGTLIEITPSGFSPNAVTISSGDTVTFINKDTEKHWPASDPHPGHYLYPETGGCIKSSFDACKGLNESETFVFMFKDKGTWTYHDHLNSELKGTITVK